MMMALTSLEEMAQLLLNEVQAGSTVHLDITSRDAATGNLLLLILTLHEAAKRREVGVVVSQVSADTIRLRLPGETQ